MFRASWKLSAAALVLVFPASSLVLFTGMSKNATRGAPGLTTGNNEATILSVFFQKPAPPY